MEALYIDNEKLPLKKHVAVTCHYRHKISHSSVLLLTSSSCFFFLIAKSAHFVIVLLELDC